MDDDDDSGTAVCLFNLPEGEVANGTWTLRVQIDTISAKYAALGPYRPTLHSTGIYQIGRLQRQASDDQETSEMAYRPLTHLFIIEKLNFIHQTTAGDRGAYRKVEELVIVRDKVFWARCSWTRLEGTILHGEMKGFRIFGARVDTTNPRNHTYNDTNEDAPDLTPYLKSITAADRARWRTMLQPLSPRQVRIPGNFTGGFHRATYNYRIQKYPNSASIGTSGHTTGIVSYSFIEDLAFPGAIPSAGIRVKFIHHVPSTVLRNPTRPYESSVALESLEHEPAAILGWVRKVEAGILEGSVEEETFIGTILEVHLTGRKVNGRRTWEGLVSFQHLSDD
ncbi:hypothetical protein BJ508DRAFT_329139 [Ascobolus immersus RN42]|uniref:Uncharacterized protein n=1 Tax=Ascobolus immersus RN42 TaxID=1160509 RepID=A0A3N4I9S9_ASCIM|nr:hypothetical protein BJ508DRAFT_329139 [Ascobolus immersus RN42]